MANPSSSTAEKKTFTLQPESELRLEIPPSPALTSVAMCTLRLQSGSAELFGCELAVDKPYPLTCTKLAIFTWHGCTLSVQGKVDIAYISTENASQVSYVNTHAQLEALRDEALENSTAGPRVLVTGPSDCGKTSLAKILSAYAVKLGRQPIFADVDVSQNLLSIPGTIAAGPLTADAVSVSTFGVSGSSILNQTTPFVLWYGSTDLTSNPDLYKSQLTKLGGVIDARLRTETAEVNASGIIVNTSGYVIEQELGYKLLLHAIDALRIDVVLIVGHDRLYSMLTSHFRKSDDAKEEKDPLSTKPPKIIKLPRSGGVVSRDTQFRRTLRISSMKKYFHGEMMMKSTPPSSTSTAKDNFTFVHQYTPYLMELPLDQLKLYKLSSVSLTASMLPVSSKQTTDPVQLQPMEFSSSLKHSILAVCHPYAVEAFEQSGEASDLYLSGVAGFIAVEKVEIEKGVISLLSPCSGTLPSNVCLVGDVTWME